MDQYVSGCTAFSMCMLILLERDNEEVTPYCDEEGFVIARVIKARNKV
jgi:hypothetical protein